MSSFLRLCLVYIIATLGVFGTFLSSAKATSSLFKTGVADRVRKHDMIEYYYHENGNKYYNSGFQCEPEPIRHDTKGIFKELDSKYKNGAADIFAATGVIGLSAIEAIAAPLMCSMTISSVFKGKGHMALSGLALVLAELTNAFIEEYVVTSDFGLDPLNGMCYLIIAPMVLQCLIFIVITNIKIIPKKIKALVLGAVMFLYQAIEEAVVITQLSLAIDVFPYLRVCGDAWYTYGYTINKTNPAPNVIEKERVDIDSIYNHYPTKGVYEGSYEYYLKNCINENNITSCTKIDSPRINNKNDAIGSSKYKAYREYTYRGMEYAYDDCEDPRPEARLYDINLDKGESQKLPQLYYARGLKGINFACERFASKTEWQDAFKCCVDASHKLLCVEYHNRDDSSLKKIHKFCELSEDGNDFCEIDVGDVLEKQKGIAGELDKKLKDLDNDTCSEFKNISDKNKCDGDKKEICKSCVVYDDVCDKTYSSDSERNVCKNYKGFCAATIDGGIDKPEENIDNKTNLKLCIDSVKESSGKYDLPTVGNYIKLKITESSQYPGKYCFTTQNFCPYDFNILGGTEKIGTEFQDSHECGINENTEKFECAFKKNSICVGEDTEVINGEQIVKIKPRSCHNQPSNFCQIDRHCMMLNPYPFKQDILPTFPYIDKACINGVGSSHNRENFQTYDSYQRAINIRNHFTAPIVECIVETTRNLLMGKAGFTKCLDESEMPYNDEKCDSGYQFKKGKYLEDYGNYETVYEKMRKSLSYIVKILLSLAIIFYGFTFVVFGKSFNKEEFIKFVAKIVFVIMMSLTPKFALTIFDLVFEFSGNVIELTYSVLQVDDWKPDYNNLKFDGCYFSQQTGFLNNYEKYPKGRKYIAFFDYIDCKFMKYLGFDIGSMDILVVILLFLFSAIITFVLALPLLVIFLTLIFIVIKIAYIFIVATLTMTVLLFFAPIIVPLCLFERTKGIFSGWVKEITNYIFYPIFLIVAATMLFFVYDTFFISDAIFMGENAPYRTVYCGWYCKTQSSGHMISVDDKNLWEKPDEKDENACKSLGGEMVDLSNYPVCLYKAKQKVSEKADNSIVSFLLDFKMPIIEIGTDLYKFLFMNNAILLMILLFIENVIDGVIDLGQSIFGANVDRSALDGMSVVNIIGKVFSSVMDAASTQLNVQYQGLKRLNVKRAEDNKASEEMKEENKEKAEGNEKSDNKSKEDKND